MPRTPAVRPREAAAALERAGFVLARTRGSHRIYVKGNTGIVIPWHGKDLRRGTLFQIIRQSGLSVGEFPKLL